MSFVKRQPHEFVLHAALLAILANADGVIVSCFEWVQNREGFYWAEELVNQRLTDKMTATYQKVTNYARKEHINMHEAAYLLAVEKIARTVQEGYNSDATPCALQKTTCVVFSYNVKRERKSHPPVFTLLIYWQIFCYCKFNCYGGRGSFCPLSRIFTLVLTTYMGGLEA